MDPDKTWRVIPGTDDKYLVSDAGDVWSHHVRRLLTPVPHQRWGYAFVTIPLDGKWRSRYIHRLMMLAFHGPSELLVRHLDGDLTNNRLDNLAYGTSAENNRDTVRHGHHFNGNVTHCPLGHSYAEFGVTRTERGGPARRCKPCQVIASQKYRQRKAEATK